MKNNRFDETINNNGSVAYELKNLRMPVSGILIFIAIGVYIAYLTVKAYLKDPYVGIFCGILIFIIYIRSVYIPHSIGLKLSFAETEITICKTAKLRKKQVLSVKTEDIKEFVVRPYNFLSTMPFHVYRINRRFAEGAIIPFFTKNVMAIDKNNHCRIICVFATQDEKIWLCNKLNEKLLEFKSKQTTG